nr:RNA-directed DNA polymerase, eukaryota, reverse transcriptase zinc-binding domain protein [Tanacetum cinerariifolium]
MACRLSKWKLKTLSIGGRLTPLKSVLGSMPIYHMSLFKVSKKVLHRMESLRSHFFNGAELSSKKSIWVKWKHALASKDKGDEGIFVGYSTISKAFRVYNTRTKKVEENLHITFLENKLIIIGGGPEWLLDIDALSESMNYAPVPAGNEYSEKEQKRNQNG